MALKTNRLSALVVNKTTVPGYYADGGGLYLQVSKSGTKSWIFRFERQGRERQMGLGPLHTVSLADARATALESRKLLLGGFDPIEVRQAGVAQIKLEAAKGITFDECAKSYIAGQQGTWKNAKHAGQWAATLATYVSPIFGQFPVQAIDTPLVVKVLQPIWQTKSETASRVRGRIESILDWATVMNYRAGENPARWRGHLDKILPAKTRVQRIKHHPALPYAEVADFIKQLDLQGGAAVQALKLLILTAARTSEIIGARRSEFDLLKKTWTIPPERMKAERAHRVPLAPAALQIVQSLLKVTESDWLLPGVKEGTTLSNMAMLELLKRMGRSDITVHGFRSSFRDWAAECTEYQSEVAEAALAHIVGDKVEAAYRRGELFDKRKAMMEDWACFCTGLIAPLKVKGSRRAQM
jgi:integrase